LDPEISIWADSLRKVYRSGGVEVVVFDELELEVRRGERLAIIGESGAGKSTLLHLLGGLDRPTSGRIQVEDHAVAALNEKDLADFRNREIGFVWQNPSLLPEFSALENIMMPLLIRGISTAAAAEASKRLLKEVGLLSRAHHVAGELSGGEQQRVSLARALIGKPRFIFADEPTGSLDFRTGETIMNLLADLHSAYRLTSVFVTHNLVFASRCDRVLELKKGCLQQTSVGELQQRE
jgi:lipoprotein-releasing system ATP-binding protein